MNKPTQFALVAFAVFALTIALGLLAAPGQDAARVVYIMVAVVLPAPIAYFLVYLDGFGRLNRATEPTPNGEERGGRDTTDANGDETDAEPTR